MGESDAGADRNRDRDADADADADVTADANGTGTGRDADGETADVRERRLMEEADRHGFFSTLGLELESAREGRAVLRVPFEESFTNIPNDSMHGGVTAALIDTASGFALRSTLEPEMGLTTTDLNVRYVRPATADLRAEARVVRAGRSVGVTECEVTSVAPDGERKVVATGGTTYRLFRGESA